MKHRFYILALGGFLLLASCVRNLEFSEDAVNIETGNDSISGKITFSEDSVTYSEKHADSLQARTKVFFGDSSVQYRY
ncbi:MAG: hypothetical protein ACO1O6_13045 [Bacteroidota bacterium]